MQWIWTDSVPNKHRFYEDLRNLAYMRTCNCGYHFLILLKNMENEPLFVTYLAKQLCYTMSAMCISRNITAIVMSDC